MYKEKKILSIITARGGSKGLPQKNIRELKGRPLINWTISASLNSKYIDRTIVSSDCLDIIEIAKKAGCDAPFLRPQELASDFASSMDVIVHALKTLDAKNQYTHFALLQPTSPLRTCIHIDQMISRFFEENHDYMVSVKKANKHPAFIYEIKDNHLVPFLNNNGAQLRRQDMTPAYEHNGAIYIASIERFLLNPSFNHANVAAFEMSPKDSIDIDDEIDFKIAEAILNDAH